MSQSWKVGVVVGNPKPASRTRDAAVLVATLLTGARPDLVVDLADYGAALLDWADPRVAEAVAAVQGLDLLVVASPTFKASYTGLLKLFLDRFAADSLAGVVAVPLMLGAGPGHMLAPEVHLKPVLAELGASCPTKALYVIDRDHADEAAYAPWLAVARPIVRALLDARLRLAIAAEAGGPDAGLAAAPTGPAADTATATATATTAATP